MKRKKPLRSDPEKVREWKRRRTPLTRGGSLKRSRIKRVNRARRKRRQDAGEVYGPYHEWMGTLACDIGGGCWGHVSGHHVRSVGAGGQDEGNEIPLCAKHHTEIHRSPSRFEARHGYDIEARAAHFLALWNDR